MTSGRNPNPPHLYSKEYNESLFIKCEPHLYKLARKYSQRFSQYDVDELIAEAWLRGLTKVSNPKYFSQRIANDIIDFIRSDTNFRKKDKIKVSNESSLHPLQSMENEADLDTIIPPRNDAPHSTVESDEFMDYLIRHTYLTKNEKKFFIDAYMGTSQIDIAKKHHNTQADVSKTLSSARKKLQTTLLRYNLKELP